MLAEGRREGTTDELSNIMPLLTAFVLIYGILILNFKKCQNYNLLMFFFFNGFLFV